MKPRIAGIASERPDAVRDFSRQMAERFAADGPEAVRTILWPEDRPVVAVVISGLRRPPVLQWTAPDGSFVVVDGEVFELGDGMHTNGGAANGATAPNGLLSRLFDLYRQDDVAALARIDAAAGIVIWDASRRQLRVLRDPLGLATTFHATRNGDVLFASEMGSLLEAGVPRRIDPDTVDYYLSKGYAPGPWTFIEGIRKIPPGHALTYRPGAAPKVLRYFRQPTHPKLALERGERNEAIREHLSRAIRLRSDPARSTAVLVGGIDSMLILGAVVRLVGAPADAFTFRYADYDGPFNEEGPARALATTLGVRHETIACGPGDIANNLMRILQDYGEPLAWGLHSCMVRTLVRNDVQTIFTGNEPTWNLRKLDLAAIRYRRVPGAIRGLVRAGWPIARRLVPRYARAGTAMMRADRTGLPPQFIHSTILSEEQRQRVYLHPEQAAAGLDASEALFIDALDEIRDEDPYDQARLLLDRFFNANGPLFWNSVWARSYDLVVRLPYCYRELRDFFYRLSAETPAKIYLRDFASTVVPPEAANAPRLPQEIPIGHWFRGPLRSLLQDGLSADAVRAAGLRPDAVNALLKDHLDGRAEHSWRLWVLLALVTWQTTILPRLGKAH